MKKLLAFLLALTLLLSVGVTAFADTYEEGIDNTQSRTQTITVNAPALTWTLEIPANLEIEFGNTDLIKMGNLKISDVSWTTLPASNFIFVNMSYARELTNAKKNSAIFFDLRCQYHTQTPHTQGKEMLSSFEHPGEDGSPPVTYHSNTEYRWADMYIQISEDSWQVAIPGENYTGTITYSSQYGTWF